MFSRRGLPHGTQAHPQLLPVSPTTSPCFAGEPGWGQGHKQAA